MIQKSDLLTGEKFVAKRRDQKFASSQNRQDYHRKKADEIRKAKSLIDRPLHANFRVLSELLKDKKTETYHRQYLLGRGFVFTVLTHYANFEGKTHKAIYNFIIVDIGNDLIKIVKNG